MGLIETVKTIKQTQAGNIVMIKIGKFIYTYGKDAYIVSYLFKYKLKEVQSNIYSCAFPNNYINNVMARLEEKKINYIVLDRRNNYRVDEESNNKNLNQYNDYLNKSTIYVKRKKYIDRIYKELINNIEKDETQEIIKQIIKVLDERRKI